MFAIPQRPTFGQRGAGSSLLQSLLTVSSTAVSAAVGFLSMSAVMPSSAEAQNLPSSHNNAVASIQETGVRPAIEQGYSLRERVYTATTVAQADGGESQPRPNFNIQATPIDDAINISDAGTGGDRLNEGNVDPINSPHPLPWSWILDIQDLILEPSASRTFYYRSPALLSPDGDHSAYARLQVLRVSDPLQSQVNSVLFLEDTDTGALQLLAASSPEMQHILLQGSESQQPGMLSMLIPISWSEEGDRVLVRAFESIFSTDIAADYAVIWHQASNQVDQIIPTNAEYSHAVLLGWSQSNPDQVLFQMGNLGDEQWPMMAMEESGDYQVMTASDQPITYGQTRASFWNGPQASIPYLLAQ